MKNIILIGLIASIILVAGCIQEEIRYAPSYPEIPKLEIDQMKLIKINEEVLYSTFSSDVPRIPNKDRYYWAFEVYVKNSGNFSVRVTPTGKEPYGTRLHLQRDKTGFYSIEKAYWLNPNTVLNESMEKFATTAVIMEGSPEFKPNDIKKTVAILPEFPDWKPIGTNTFSFVLSADLYDINASFYKNVVLDEFQIATA